jgi:hypothetical protein
MNLVREMQRLRGSVYLADGAVERRQLSDDGLHRTPEDRKSWHLLMLSAAGHVTSCAWYLQHGYRTTLEQLRARRCPLRHDPAKREMFETAVQSELERARREDLPYAEVGGWAVSKQSRCTAEGLVLALAAYGLSRALGGALGMTTATVRNSSSAILRRLGGSHLDAYGVAIEPYFDQAYRCEMEVLRFDSRSPSAKYVPLIDRIQRRLAAVRVLSAHGLRDFGAVELDSSAAA